MKKFLTASFILLFSLAGTRAFAQHPVIFETFQDDQQDCPGPTDFQNYITGSGGVMPSVGAKNYSKVIHLDHHVGDVLASACVASGIVGNQLEPAQGGSFYLLYGAVNRLNPEFGISISGNTLTPNTSWVSDMESQINAGYTTPPPTSISLSNATLDKSTGQDNFRAMVSVTATADISDSVIIHYAILEDNVSNAICTSAFTHNDVVRFVTYGDSVVFLPGTSSGTVANVSFYQTHINITPEKPANMRFIVFLEEPGKGIIDAAQLIQDLDTVSAPPPTLSINSSKLDDSTFAPGQSATISYSATNLPNGVDLYFSTNAGNTWLLELTAQASVFNTINWTVPDTLTTQGKIKLVGTGYPTLFSTETGTFSIATPAFVKFDYPPDGVILHSDSLVDFRWSKGGVGNVTLQYCISDNTGHYPTFTPIVTNTSDTFYNGWKVPDTTTRGVEFQLVPVNHEAPAAPIIDTIKALAPDAVNPTVSTTSLSIQNIYPNPSTHGEEMVIEYSNATAKPMTLDVLDLLGQEVNVNHSTSNGVIRLNTSGLTSGTYVVRLSDGTNTVSKQIEVLK